MLPFCSQSKEVQKQTCLGSGNVSSGVLSFCFWLRTTTILPSPSCFCFVFFSSAHYHPYLAAELTRVGLPVCGSADIIHEKMGMSSFTRDKGCSLIPREEQIRADCVCLEGSSLFGCWTTAAVACLFCYCGKSGAEPVTCHLFFECNQLFFHGPFGVTVNDGSG